MAVSAGFIVYSAVMPLLPTVITILLGFLLAKLGLFPPAASRGASQICMNLALPALIFASIVPSFNSQNIGALGPLILLGIIYEVIPLCIGFIIREVCYVPRNFWQGIIVACAISNWGNLPSAIVYAVTGQEPFDPATDPQLGISFVSIFILVCNVSFWVFGAANSLRWDYAPDVPQDETAFQRVSWKEKPIGGWIHRMLAEKRHNRRQRSSVSLDEKLKGKPPCDEQAPQPIIAHPASHSGDYYPADNSEAVEDDVEQDPDIQLARRSSRLSAHSMRSRRPSAGAASTNQQRSKLVGILTPPHPSMEDLHANEQPFRSASPDARSEHSKTVTVAPEPQTRLSKMKENPVLAVLFSVLHNLLNPVTITLVIAVIVALVVQLKALFVDASDIGGSSWSGPDGRPPLHFVYSTASLVGDMTIPLSLLLLGGSFARMHKPKDIKNLAIPAMVSVTILKLIVLPVFGILIVQAMVSRGLIPAEAKAQRFVAMLLSGSPSAVNQVVVSALYAGDNGNMDTLSAFLLMQYVCMFFSSAAITAVSLTLL